MSGSRPSSQHRVAVLVWLLGLMFCAVVIARTQFRTDMAAFLPRSAPMAEQVLTAQASSGAASHLVLLAISGAPVPVLARLSSDLAANLRQQAAFVDVLNGGQGSFAGIEDFIWRNRYLLSPNVNAAAFSASGLHAALQNDLALLDADAGAFAAQSIPADPTGEVMALLPELTVGGGPASRNGVWFSADGRLALLLVHTSAPGFDLDGQQRALSLIQSGFATERAKIPGAAGARLQMSGPGVFAIHIRDRTKADVTRLSILAMAGAIALLFFAYRSPLVLILGILPVASGALAAIAAVSLVFGFVHGVTLGFGVTLIGESLDYAIYLFTQTADGDGATDTLRRIWPTLRLGALTSIAGFAAMLFSDFTGFAQLGLFSIVGLITAAGVTRFILPQFLPAGFAAATRPMARPVLQLIAYRRPLRWLLALAMACAFAALLLHKGGFWDENLNNLSPVPAADAKLDSVLRGDFGLGDIRYFAVVTAADGQQALARSESLSALLRPLVASGKLSGFNAPSQILPSDATQAQRQAALPDAAALQANLTAAANGLPFRTHVFAPFLRDAAKAKTAPLISAENLPPALRLQLQSTLAVGAGGFVAMAPLQGVTDPTAVAAAMQAAHLPGLSFVDLNAESGALLWRFQREAVTLAVTGCIAISLLLLGGLRSVRRALTVAAPLAAAVLITLALLTVGPAKISIFMVVGLLLIVAVGSNYCLFFERAEPDAATRQRSIASIVLANLCTVCAYGLMSFSKIPVLHDIGMTVALGTFLCLICAAILSREALPC
jgi:predicted exporter